MTISIKDLTEEQRADLHKDPRRGWVLHRSTRGGKLADLPEPRLCLSDVRGYRRAVDVKVTRWMTHYYVSVEEENPYYWDDAEKAWRQPWDAPSVHETARYAHERFVIPFVERVFARHFDKRTHRIDWDRPSKRMWVYSRQGD